MSRIEQRVSLKKTCTFLDQTEVDKTSDENEFPVYQLNGAETKNCPDTLEVRLNGLVSQQQRLEETILQWQSRQELMIEKLISRLDSRSPHPALSASYHYAQPATNENTSRCNLDTCSSRPWQVFREDLSVAQTAAETVKQIMEELKDVENRATHSSSSNSGVDHEKRATVVNSRKSKRATMNVKDRYALLGETSLDELYKQSLEEEALEENKKPGHKKSMASAAGDTVIDSRMNLSSKIRESIQPCASCLKRYIRHPIRRVIRNRFFDYMIAAVIMINTVIIGVQTEMYAAKRGQADADTLDSPEIWFYIEVVFAIIFTAEVVARLLAEMHKFFYGVNWRWNFFDSVVVISSLLDMFGADFLSGNNRLVRVLRLIRILRLIRVMRFLHDLRKMIMGIISTLSALFWAMILLLMVMFLFAVLVTEIITGAWDELTELAADDDRVGETLVLRYNSLSSTAFSLFQGICSGVDWAELSDVLMHLSWMYGVLFIIYISFAVFCVLNIVTAVFVEHANKMCDNDREQVVMEEIATRQKFQRDLMLIFKEADQDGSGTLNRSEFDEHFSDLRVKALMSKMEVDMDSFATGGHSGAAGLFDLLDVEGIGEVDVDVFMEGVSQLKGFAKSFDIYRLQHDLARITSELYGIQELIGDRQTTSSSIDGMPAGQVSTENQHLSLKAVTNLTKVICQCIAQLIPPEATQLQQGAPSYHPHSPLRHADESPCNEMLDRGPESAHGQSRGMMLCCYTSEKSPMKSTTFNSTSPERPMMSSAVVTETPDPPQLPEGTTPRVPDSPDKNNCVPSGRRSRKTVQSSSGKRMSSACTQ